MFESWELFVFVAQIETAGLHQIKILAGDVWYSMPVDAYQLATDLMVKCLDDPQYLQNLVAGHGGSLDESKLSRVTARSFGFTNLELRLGFEDLVRLQDWTISSDAEAPKLGLDLLDLGNILAAKIEDPNYLPTTESEISLFWDYLNQYSMTMGLFGNFKCVLKGLVHRFERIYELKNSKLTETLAACLGSGFGQVEAYLSKGPLSPEGFLGWKSRGVELVGFLPEFGSRRYPSLKTAQYLSRMGLRTFSKIRRSMCPLAETRFRLDLLSAADSYDEFSWRFPHYQILVSEAVGHSRRLPARDSSGRKLDKTNARAGANSDVPFDASQFKGLIPEQEDLLKTWVANLVGNNPLITRHAFELSKHLGVAFPWNDKTLAILGDEPWGSLRSSLISAVKDRPELYWRVNTAHRARLLDSFDFETIKRFGWLSWSDASWGLWLDVAASKSLSQDAILLAKILILKGGLWSMPMHADTGRTRQKDLFINLARHSEFRPLEEWEELISRFTSRLDTDEFVQYLGADPEVDGVLDVIEQPDGVLLDLLARTISQRTSIKLLVTLLSVANPCVQKVGIRALQLRPIHELGGFLIGQNDPSLLLDVATKLVNSDGAASFVGLLGFLGQESQQPFWRINGSEFDQLVENWAEFPSLIWKSLDAIPQKVLERIENYSWFRRRLLGLVNAKQIARCSENQAALVARAIENVDDLQGLSGIIKAIVTSPISALSDVGLRTVHQANLMPELWLPLLESGLPGPSRAAIKYLESQSNSSNFGELLLMALDSNNQQTRLAALQIMNSRATPEVVRGVVAKLAENRNPDIWGVVRQHLSQIEDDMAIRKFTNRVFLSRRKARKEKEKIKERVALLIREARAALDHETLVRMALSSSSSDREWALRQIANGAVEVETISVESAWGTR